MTTEQRFQRRQREGKLYTLRQIGREDLGYQFFQDEILFPDDECVEIYLDCCDDLDKYKFAEDARKTARKAAEAAEAAEAAKAPELDYPTYDSDSTSDLE